MRICKKYDFRGENFCGLLVFAAPKNVTSPNFVKKTFANLEEYLLQTSSDLGLGQYICHIHLLTMVYVLHISAITWARFLWSHPQTTSHMVLVRPRGD